MAVAVRGIHRGKGAVKYGDKMLLKAMFSCGSLFPLRSNGAPCSNRETLLGALHCSEKVNVVNGAPTGSDNVFLIHYFKRRRSKTPPFIPRDRVCKF